MPLRNRVDPFGEIHAVPARGLFTGNRGVLHDPDTRTLRSRRWTTKAWIVCSCDWKGRRREPMGRNGRWGGAGWTELFFLDEVTALAAGHRPCFTCRREAALRFQACFYYNGIAGFGPPHPALRANFSPAGRREPLPRNVEQTAQDLGAPLPAGERVVRAANRVRGSFMSAPAMDRILHAERLASGGAPAELGQAELAALPDGAVVAVAGTPHAMRAGALLPWSFCGYGAPGAVGPQAAILITPLSTVAALAAGYRPVWHPSAPS